MGSKTPLPALLATIPNAGAPDDTPMKASDGEEALEECRDNLDQLEADMEAQHESIMATLRDILSERAALTRGGEDD